VSEPVRVLLVSGSTRAGSGNTAALATAAAVAPGRVRAVLYDGLAGTISDPGFRAEAAQVWDALLDFLGGR
jgi:NAD(P)H-dependent FMN reductase